MSRPNSVIPKGSGRAYAGTMRSFAITFALTLATAATAQQPNPARLYQTAEAEQQSGDLTGAIRDYRAVIAAKPGMIEAHAGLGAALAQHGEYDAAISELNSALGMLKDKNQPDLLLALGVAYQKKGDLAHAKQEFQAVLVMQPANTKPKKVRQTTIDAATHLAEIDLKLNDPESAIAALEPRGFLAEQNVEFARAYGLAMVRTGKFHEGAQILRRVAETANQPNLYFVTGAILLQNDETDDARRDLETIHRINPSLPGLESLLGLDRVKANDAYAAEKSFRQALRTQPDDLLANLYLGALLLDYRHLDTGKPYLEHAITLPLTTPPALAEVGVALSPSSQLDPAIEILQRVASANPSWTEPHRVLAVLYTTLQRPEEAAVEQKLSIPPQ